MDANQGSIRAAGGSCNTATTVRTPRRNCAIDAGRFRLISAALALAPLILRRVILRLYGFALSAKLRHAILENRP